MTDIHLDAVLIGDPGQPPVPAAQDAALPDALTLSAVAEVFVSGIVLPPAALDQSPPIDERPAVVKKWFDGAVLAAVPEHDGTLETARAAAQAYARHAKAHNTRRAYRAGVRAWCDWCHRHALPCLPADPADVWPSWPPSAAADCRSPPSSRHPLPPLHRRVPGADR